ncbi:MAG: peptidoglycan DD-metalloendopeptidase family protein [Xanthobacteraceae bacterium]
MILRRSSRTDPRFVLGPALALALPIGAGFGACLEANSVAWAQTPEQLSPADAAAQSSTEPSPPSPGMAPPAADQQDAIKQHDQELDSALARQRESVQSQAKLRIEIEALAQDRRKFNQDLIGTAARVRDVEASIDATRARLAPLDEQDKLLRKSLNDRRDVIVEILAALQRIGRQPPPALIVRPEDALQAVRTAITLGAVLPEMRAQANLLAGDLAELVRVRQQIVNESDRLSSNLHALGRDQLRLALLIDQRQKKEAVAEQALNAERQRATVLARQVDSVKDLIAKLEAGLNPATRAAHDAAQSIAKDATQPQLAALSDPGRLAPAVAFADMRGHMRLPVNGETIREFGGADGVGGSQKGVSIAARPEAEITAPCDGWVVYAGPFRSYGQLLILNAGGGYHVLLAGMDRISVDLGQFVLTGEPVAMMGDSSQRAAAVTTGPKQPVLYVEFRKDGTPIDPRPWWATNEGEKVRG